VTPRQKTVDIGKLFHWSGKFDTSPEDILDNGIVRGNPNVVRWYIKTTGRKDYAITRLRFWIERNKFVRPWDKRRMIAVLGALSRKKHSRKHRQTIR